MQWIFHEYLAHNLIVAINTIVAALIAVSCASHSRARQHAGGSVLTDNTNKTTKNSTTHGEEAKGDSKKKEDINVQNTQEPTADSGKKTPEGGSKKKSSAGNANEAAKSVVKKTQVNIDETQKLDVKAVDKGKESSKNSVVDRRLMSERV
ncbi:hypothetical protein DICVIV_07878 [Dictyocaulus viviparus]|uniref:Uncharacterized protein n=1 Tax=Dictyocaulus viviparus TaxID=29172 RepID=A0A0D8XN41_DICVI|nr:hypothetical protein DICVIV_07878 [Dictyocaulus viviparus]